MRSSANTASSRALEGSDGAGARAPAPGARTSASSARPSSSWTTCRPHLLRPRAAGRTARRPRRDLRRHGPRPGRAAQGRLARRGARGLRPAGWLHAAPGRSLDAAMGGGEGRGDAGDGPARRLAGQPYPARRAGDHRAWRLPPRQPDHPPDRAAHRRGAGLGTGDDRASAGRSRLLLPDLSFRPGAGWRDRRGGHGPRRHRHPG